MSYHVRGNRSMFEMLENIRVILREWPVLAALARSIITATAIFTLVGLVIVLFESRGGRDTSRYRSRHFYNDIVYTLLYQGGLYNVLLYAPLFAVAGSRLDFLKVDALTRLPSLMSIAVYWVLMDFTAYWIHRFQHRSTLLWAFHSVHHTQTRMTFLTSNRNHIFEQLYVNVLLLAPTLFLGIPPRIWMPLYFLQVFFEHAQHAQLRWDYGPLHRWLVSPTFHAMHHSTDSDEYNGNYGKLFSVWDRWFGTHVVADHEPRQYGVEDMHVPESLAAQFVHPFRWLGGVMRREGESPDHSTSSG